MSMSMHAVAIVPPDDDKFEQYKKIWDACVAADIDIPDEVLEYFDEEPPHEEGIVRDIGSEYGPNHPCCSKWSDGSHCGGYEIEIDKLPPNTKRVRVYCAY